MDELKEPLLTRRARKAAPGSSQLPARRPRSMGSASTAASPNSAELSQSPESLASPEAGSEEDSRLKAAAPAPGRLATMVNLTGAILGAGILSLPYSFQLAGWAAGAVVLGAGSLTGYTAILIVRNLERAMEVVPEKERQGMPCDWPLLGYACFGELGKKFVNGVFLTDLWFTLMAFLVVNGSNMQQLLPWIANAKLIGVSGFLSFLLMFFPLHALSWLSIVGHLAMGLAVTLVIGTGVYNYTRGDMPETSSYMWLHAPGLGQVVGIVVFCNVAHGTIPTIYRTCGCKKQFPAVSAASFASAAGIYLVTGSLGFLFFAGVAQQNMIGNIARDLTGTMLAGLGALPRIASLGFVIKLQLIFPIYASPIVCVTEAALGISEAAPLAVKALWRALVVAFTTLTAIILRDNMADCLALTGSLLSMCTAILFPTVFYFILHREQLSYGSCAILGVITLFGLYFQVTGTIDSLIMIFGL